MGEREGERLEQREERKRESVTNITIKITHVYKRCACSIAIDRSNLKVPYCTISYLNDIHYHLHISY